MGDNLILKKVRFFLWHPRIKIIRTIWWTRKCCK